MDFVKTWFSHLTTNPRAVQFITKNHPLLKGLEQVCINIMKFSGYTYRNSSTFFFCVFLSILQNTLKK